ncbi:hypothetical protein GEM_5809 [Burkholderia cepacia GG4]|uniref:Uncharacterized protein n=1 Tax=Burkholderia cepacia GG4 TaxID=1009846 RepID=A0A9W3K7W1_BURCE|nr:hypothetical protein GEM_5809 [Burkholderia cepacia GG4]
MAGQDFSVKQTFFQAYFLVWTDTIACVNMIFHSQQQNARSLSYGESTHSIFRDVLPIANKMTSHFASLLSIS